MNPELQQRIQNLMGDNSRPNLVTTEMPSESDFGQYSSVSVLPKSDNNGLVEGKDYVTVGGQMFWPWELEGIMGKDGAFDAKAVNQFIESLPQKPNLKELSSLRDFANPPSSTREVSNLMGATLSPMEAGQVSDKEMDLYNKSLSMAEGGEVSREEMMMQAMGGEAQGQADPNEAIRSSIEELMMQASQAEDPAERDQYLHLAEAAEVGSQAPMGEMAIQLAQAGRGEDTALAHVRPGEVVIPPEAFEDPEFESLIEKKFEELNIDPARMVVGVGIASLNPITGLEEFGFFKKLAKSVKKVVKKVIKPLAQVAQFIPGPWQPIAALANKAFTVYDVAKGRANPLSLLTVAGPGAIGGSIGENIGAISKAGSGSFLKGLGSLGKASFSSIGSSVGNIGKGIGGLFTGGGKDGIGKFGRIGDFAGGISDSLGMTDYASQAAERSAVDTISNFLTENPDKYDAINEMYAKGMTDEQISQKLLGQAAERSAAESISKFLTENPDKYDAINEMYSKGMTDEQISQQLLGGSAQVDQGGSWFGGAKTPAAVKAIEDILKGQRGSGSGNGGFNLGGLGGAGIAAVLAKLAYDEAKNRKGVQLTPAMTMSRYGGYQLAKRDAEAAGEAAPDRRDFGMMEDMPVLSGGRKTPVAEEPVTGMRYGGEVMPMQMRYGGMVPMSYATGGNVSTEDFKKKNGKINGEGTETSDDIPAMLSDGEFVMTGRAVRGAGSFDMDSNNGIITLTPKGGEDRDKGTQLMYQMMELFAEYADKPKAKRVKAA
jgi:hypothetical protein